MERTRAISHGGKPMVLLDFTHLLDEKEAAAAFEQARRFIATHPPGTVRTLTDVTGSRGSDAVIEGLKALARANKPYVKAGAVVGLTGVQRILFKAVMAFAGRNLSAFASQDEARAWLATQ